MGNSIREQLIETAKSNFISGIEKHRMNVEVMLNNPLAIHDHSDWMGAMEKEIAMIAEYKDKLSVLNSYFSD